MTKDVSLVLASASPARLGVLKAAGIDPLVRVSEVDEAALEREYVAHRGLGQADSAGLAVVLAQAKAQEVANQLSLIQRADQGLVVGADTILEFDGKALGKPGDAETATKRLTEMSGGEGLLHTGHCVVDLESGRSVGQAEATPVRFAELSRQEIEAYVATGEPLHVAGSFTIDGFGSAFVTGIDGNFTNVVGLSIPLLRDLVKQLGYEWTDLRRK